MGKIFDWVDSRFGIRDPHKRFLRRPVLPGINYSYCFGGAAFTVFLTSVVSGLFLSVYYVPSEADAYASVVRIHDDVWLGWFIRSMHRWSASLLIAFIILHVIRVIMTGAYRPPRELNWVAGSLTFFLSMGSGFSGYLLPWDQRAYWATVVGTSMARTVPVIGNTLLYAVRGGPDVDGTTLIRFYCVPVLYLPLMMSLILWAHFHMVKKQGIGRGL